MRKFTQRFFYKRLSMSMLFLACSLGSYAQYCIPTSNYGCSDDDDINSFILEGENGTAFNDLNTGCSTNSYDNKTSLPAVSLAQGFTYTAKISSDYGEESGYIWIDFNDNMTFETSELVGSLDEGIYSSLSNVNIAIPASAAAGNHRMRVTSYYPYLDGVAISNPSPCNTGSFIYDYGETHDYTIAIIAPPACASPTNLSVSVTASTATLNWNETGNYIVEYGAPGFTPGTGATAGGGTIVLVSGSTQTISNLSANTAYDFYVRHDCSASAAGYSYNASRTGIQTLPPPPANDLCSGATALTPNAVCQPTAGTTVGTTSSGDSSPDCEYSNNGDVWYSFVATGTEYDINVSNILATSPEQDFSTLGISLLSGDCSGLTELDCSDGYAYGNDNSFSVNESGLVQGSTYYIRLWKDVIYDVDGNFIQGDMTYDICLTSPNQVVNIGLVSITAKNTGASNQINWSTASEGEGDYFELERSTDGKNFAFLSKINNRERPSDYVFSDKNPIKGINYYRLKLINADGKLNYSNIVQATVSNGQQSNVEVYPNPATKKVTVHVSGLGNGKLTLTDLSGRTIYQTQMTGSEMNVDLSALVEGFYFIHYVDGNINEVVKVSKQ